MAKHKVGLESLILIIVLALIPSTAFSAPRITAGTQCKTINQKASYQDKTFTCLKSGKKLVWVQGTPFTKKGSKGNSVLDVLNFKSPMIYNVKDGNLIRRADSGNYFESDSRSNNVFDAIRIKAYNELNENSRSRVHPNIDFTYSISSSFPKFLIEHSKRELDEAAALWDSYFDRKINVNVYLVTEQDRESIKSNFWLQRNLPEVFTRFESKRERPFIAGGGGYWMGNSGWAGNIFLATASYLDQSYINYEWPAVAKHEFVHLVQDFAFARTGRNRGIDEAVFYALQLQNFREGSANTIGYLTAFRNIGWSNDAMDWLIWRRAEDFKNWKTVKSLAEVKELMIATDQGTPNEAHELSYAVGALMYEWFIGTYGFEGYKKVINEFASASSFSQAVENALGIKKEDLYNQMAPYVFKSYQKVYSRN
jgi:hypothetical protein